MRTIRPESTLDHALAAELHADIAAHARQLRSAAVHVAGLDDPERPRDAMRLARSLKRFADRADAATLHGAGTPHKLLRLRDELDEITIECSRYLVRDGVRRLLAPEQFAAVSDSAVLVGELAKVAFGELLMSVRAELLAPGGRSCSFDVNPLHAFTPAIAAGHAWSRSHANADDVDRRELTAALTGRVAAWSDVESGENPIVHPTSVMTADALGAFVPDWMLRCDDELVRDFDRLVDRTLPALDGCGIEPLELETWISIGAMSGVLRSLQARCPDSTLRIDTCDATILLPALVHPDCEAGVR